MSKRVKSFNNHLYAVECEQEQAKAPTAKKLHDALYSFDTPFKTISGVEEYLKEKTGWSNPTMSASSLGLEEEYQFIIDNIDTINVDSFTDDFEDITTEAREIIREKNTVYWTKEDSQTLEEVRELLEKINSYSHRVKSCLYQTPNGSYSFSESMFSNYNARMR